MEMVMDRRMCEKSTQSSNKILNSNTRGHKSILDEQQQEETNKKIETKTYTHSRVKIYMYANK